MNLQEPKRFTSNFIMYNKCYGVGADFTVPLL